MAKKRVSIKKTAVEVKSSVNVSKKTPKKAFVLGAIVVLILALGFYGYKQLIVATVNGEMVSRLSVVKELEKQGGQKVLDTIIIKKLIAQEANKQKVVISQKDVDSEMVKVEANVAAQGATLDQLLQQQGMTKNDLLDELRVQLMVTKMVDKDITISDKEVEDYITAQKQQSLAPGATPAPEMTKEQATAQIKQQKLSTKIQTFIAELKSKAKINYLISY